MSKRERKKSRKWIWIIIVIVILGGAGYYGFTRVQNNIQEVIEANTGDVVTVFIGDLSASATASGQLEAERETQLALGATGTVAEVLVEVGDSVVAGETLLTLETAALERNIQNAEQSVIIAEANLETLLAPPSNADVVSAEAAVASAEASLADLLAGPSENEIASAEAKIRAAQSDIAAARARVGSAAGSASADEIAAAEIQLQLAQASATSAAEQHSTILVTDNEYISEEQLADMELSARSAALQANADLLAAQEALNLLQNGDGSAVASASAGVAIAEAQLGVAEAQMAQLLTPPSASQIAQAEASIAQAESSLDRLLAGPTNSQITTAEIQVEQAKIGLQRAQNALDDAILLAPFAGTVTAVHVQAGEQASGLLVEITETEQLEIVLNVDEVDVGKISIGQEAVITLETWPSEEIVGEVTAIAPKSSGAGALVTYEVFVALGETELPARVGMTANANLVTARRDGVLLLPNAAINADRSKGTYSVNLVSGETDGIVTTEEVEISIGLRDAGVTQVLSGLEEGDEVMIGSGLPTFDFGSGPPPGAGN